YQQVVYAGEPLAYGGELVVRQSALVPSTLEEVAPVLDAIIADAQEAERIDTLLGSWRLDGLQVAIPQPIAGGYRLGLTWLTASARISPGSFGYGAYGAGVY